MVTKENQIKYYEEELKELEFSVKKQFNATGTFSKWRINLQGHKRRYMGLLLLCYTEIKFILLQFEPI
jgi:translation initiation factor 1 (eIF-1/SUI1)